MSASLSIADSGARRKARPLAPGWIEAHTISVLESDSSDVLAYLQRRTQNPEDAADLLGDVMLAMWEKRSRVPEDSVEARMWYFGIARNLLRRHRQTVRRQAGLSDELRAQLATAAFMPPSIEHPTAGYDPMDVRKLIARLPAIEQEIVTLVNWEGFSLEDIARMLGMPAGTVRNRYSRARTRLRADL